MPAREAQSGLAGCRYWTSYSLNMHLNCPLHLPWVKLVGSHMWRVVIFLNVLITIIFRARNVAFVSGTGWSRWRTSGFTEEWLLQPVAKSKFQSSACFVNKLHIACLSEQLLPLCRYRHHRPIWKVDILVFHLLISWCNLLKSLKNLFHKVKQLSLMLHDDDLVVKSKAQLMIETRVMWVLMNAYNSLHAFIIWSVCL